MNRRSNASVRGATLAALVLACVPTPAPAQDGAADCPEGSPGPQIVELDLVGEETGDGGIRVRPRTSTLDALRDRTRRLDPCGQVSVELGGVASELVRREADGPDLGLGVAGVEATEAELAAAGGDTGDIHRTSAEGVVHFEIPADAGRPRGHPFRLGPTLDGALLAGPSGEVFVLTVGTEPVRDRERADDGPRARIPRSELEQAVRAILEAEGMDASRTRTDGFNRYDRERDRAVLFYGPRGEALYPVPFHFDQNDRFSIYVVHPARGTYDVVREAGDFAPSALTVRERGLADAVGAITPQGAAADVETLPTGVDYTVRHFGPFTSDRFRFTVAGQIPGVGQGDSTATVSALHELAVNRLVDVDLRVSVVNSFLANPTFRVARLPPGAVDPGAPGDTLTIVADEDERRAVLVVSAAFYNWFWLTDGRDFHKKGRWYDYVQPTVGAAITEDVVENFFVGLNLDVTPGLGVTAGGHYGRVRELAERGDDGGPFRLGESVFRGGDTDDVEVAMAWELDLYVGVQVAPRVVTSLLGR